MEPFCITWLWMLLLCFLLTPLQEVAVANVWVQAPVFSCEPLFSVQTSLLQSLPPVTFPSGCLQKVETKASKREQSRIRCRPFGHLIYSLFIVRFMHFRRQRQWCPLPIVQSCRSEQMILCKWALLERYTVACECEKLKFSEKDIDPPDECLTSRFCCDQRKQNKARTRWDGDAQRKGRSHTQPRQWGGADAFPTSDADRQDWHPDTRTYWVIC